MKVFILVTVRKPELLPFSLLVFKTLRRGFPTAEIFVSGNALKIDISGDIEAMCGITGYCDMGVPTIHHEWIEKLVQNEDDPFVICDTDMVFYDKVEDWKFETSIAGFRTPEWEDRSGHITRSRLHGSLMFINPVKLQAQLAPYMAERPLTPFMPPANPIHPILIPINGRLHFFDTMSVAYHLIGGTAFTDQQKDTYFHFHAGTIPDLILPMLDNPESIEKEREWIMEDPQRGRGMWRAHEKYFENHVPKYDGAAVNIFENKQPGDAEAAAKWNAELTCGNKAAMQFNDLWYRYVHSIDDLLDLMQDGRPTLSKDQILSIFFNAALLYTCPFFVANRELLFPLILDITHTYAISVGWERTPEWHLRAMADVMRTAGNRMYSMVALLCGGEQHGLEMSRKIYISDWVRQHDAQGRPI